MAIGNPPRLEVVLSPEERASLDRLLLTNDETEADWVRRKLVEDCTAPDRAERRAALAYLASMRLELPLDPADLKREILEMYDLPAYNP